MASPDAIDGFIARRQDVTASELATAQSFVIELCRLLDLPEPHHAQDYMFERPVSFRHGDGSSSAGRIDCYRRGSFVLEAKKLKVGAGDTALNAKEMAIHEKRPGRRAQKPARYPRSLRRSRPRPDNLRWLGCRMSIAKTQLDGPGMRSSAP